LNKHAEYYENLDLFGCFGDQGSLEVAHILFFCFFYYLIVSSGIRAKVDCFLQQSPIHIITMSFWNEEERARLDKMRSEFFAYKEEASKRMEEIRKRIESFSPPRTSLATKSDWLMPKPQVVLETRTRNKKAEDSVKDTTLAEPSTETLAATTETLAATTAHKQTLEPLGRFPKLDNQLSPPYLSLTPP